MTSDVFLCKLCKFGVDCSSLPYWFWILVSSVHSTISWFINTCFFHLHICSNMSWFKSWFLAHNARYNVLSVLSTAHFPLFLPLNGERLELPILLIEVFPFSFFGSVSLSQKIWWSLQDLILFADFSKWSEPFFIHLSILKLVVSRSRLTAYQCC